MAASVIIPMLFKGIDEASNPLNGMFNNILQKFGKFKEMTGKFAAGGALMGAGVKLAQSMAPAVQAYANLQEAQVDLKTSMMDSTGAVSTQFKEISTLAETLGNKLPGTTADFYTLFKTMMNNGVSAASILDRVGKAAAYLAVDLKMPYEVAGEFAARMKEATGVADAEMFNFLDTISRANSIGIKAEEMKYAFSRSAGSLKTLGLQGLKSSQDMTAFFAVLGRSGQSGEMAATSFNSIARSIMDPEKLKKIQAEAGKLGVSFEFFKDGKFDSVETMVAQFDKLRGMDPRKTAAVINAITGGGQDAEALGIIINKGLGGYKKMQEELAKKAALEDKVNAKLETLNALWEATTGTIENLKAALGAGLEPVLVPIIKKIGEIAGSIKNWLQENPAMARFIGMVITLSGTFLTLMGAVKIIQGIRLAMSMLNLTMGANPFVRIAMLIIGLISLIYANWDGISKWFSEKFDAVSNVVTGFVEGARSVLSGVVNFFTQPIAEAVNVMIDLFNKPGETVRKMVEKIKKLISSIGRGVLKFLGIHVEEEGAKPVAEVAKVTKDMRDQLPSSPAKKGALRDINKLKFVEPIAQNIKVKAPILMNAVDRLTRPAHDLMAKTFGNMVPLKPAFAGASGGGGNIVANFNIHLNGSATNKDGALVANECRRQFEELWRQHQERQKRITLGSVA